MSEGKRGTGPSDRKVSSIVDNIFKEFLEKKTEVLEQEKRASKEKHKKSKKEHKSHKHKKHKKDHSRERNSEERHSDEKHNNKQYDGEYKERCVKRQGLDYEDLELSHKIDVIRDQSELNSNNSQSSSLSRDVADGGELSCVTENVAFMQAQRDIGNIPVEIDLKDDGKDRKKGKKHKKHKHKERDQEKKDRGVKYDGDKKEADAPDGLRTNLKHSTTIESASDDNDTKKPDRDSCNVSARKDVHVTDTSHCRVRSEEGTVLIGHGMSHDASLAARWKNDTESNQDEGSVSVMILKDATVDQAHFESDSKIGNDNSTFSVENHDKGSHWNDKKDKGLCRSGGSSVGSKFLEHLWHDEDIVNSEPSADQQSTTEGASVHDDSCSDDMKAPDGTTSWMILPKELEQNAGVNASAWMRLPKDELAHLNDAYDSDKDFTEILEEDTDSGFIAGKKKKALWGPVPKMDLKLDMSKIQNIVSPPSSKTMDLITSIKDSLIGDLNKMETNPPESACSISNAKDDHDPVAAPSDSKQSSEQQEQSTGLKKSLGFGRQMLGINIKISKTSAALIASGEQVESDPKKVNREEGEVTDSSAATHADSSSSSEIHISELSSSGSLSDSDLEKSSSERKKRKDRKHKKKKKKDRKQGRQSRSRTPKKYKRSRSRSRSGSRSQKHKRTREFDEEKGVWREESSSRSRGHRRSRSRERHRHSRDRDYKHRSRSRDRYHESRWRHSHRHRSRSPLKSSGHDLRVKIDKAKLRQIAFQNAYANLQRGQVAGLGLKPDEVAAIKAGGKSVQELTDFCKKIAERQSHLSSSDSDSSMRDQGSDGGDVTFISHPFKMKDTAAGIVMNIRNARQIPILTPAEKQAQGAELRLQFPVSSGTHHRAKETEWVPVNKTNAVENCQIVTNLAAAKTASKPSVTMKTAVIPGTTAPDVGIPAGTLTSAAPAAPLALSAPPESVQPGDNVFPDAPTGSIDVGQVVSERLSALRKLNQNPNDVQAMGAMYKAQEAMNQWAQSKNLPGQFTGSTGANILTQAELSGIHQAWAKKDQLRNAAPVSGGIGKFLLQKMGWKEGTGLGKEGGGKLEPLMLDLKVDRKGLTSTGEHSKKTTNIPMTKDLSAKHPVSGLVELCNRRKWGPPNFILVHESGPDHKKNFLFKVLVNGMEYQSTIASTNKKQAKAQAATICLQQLGLVPR